ncbi:MAG: homocysteine S-methyltransferase family protein [Bacteroidota bacterium]
METVASQPFILTEGSIIERLRRDPSVKLDPHVLNAGLIYEAEGSRRLSALYRQYLAIGQAYNASMIVCTPTWRANPTRLKNAGFSGDRDVNADSVHFVSAVRSEYGEYASKIFIGGLIGCAGDAYKPDEALTAPEAVLFHRPQVRALVQAGVDFLLAATLPACSEALGIAQAIADQGVPYVLSFVLRRDGSLLDGTPLAEAMHLIDSTVSEPPFFYMGNCIHPATFEQALADQIEKSSDVRNRVLGLQANTSLKSPEKLENLLYLDSTPPEPFGQRMAQLHRRYGIKVLGGCCGTDDRHIEAIANEMKRNLSGHV